MDAFELNEMVVIVMLFCVGIMLSKLAALVERMKRIETLILSLPGVNQASLNLSSEVEELIDDGHKYKAMILHRTQTESCARSAESAVEEYIAQRAMIPKK